MTTAAPLSLRPGELYRTDSGNVIEIISFGVGCKDGFPVTGALTDGSFTRISGDGLTRCGQKLIELLPDPVAVAKAAYAAGIMADELALAHLLGWKNFREYKDPCEGYRIKGSHDKARGHTSRDCLVPMPAWRRTSDAAELISICQLSIAPTDGGVAVHAETGPVIRAIYHEHPSKDHAIWFAMCRAAIAYLEAK